MTYEFTTKIKGSRNISLYGKPMVGRDFGENDIPNFDPKFQDMYADIRGEVEIQWTGDIRISTEGIFGIDCTPNKIIAELDLDFWSEIKEYEFTRTVPLVIDFSESYDEEGWQYAIEISNNTGLCWAVPHEIEINLDSRMITVIF